MVLNGVFVYLQGLSRLMGVEWLVNNLQLGDEGGCRGDKMRAPMDEISEVCGVFAEYRKKASHVWDAYWDDLAAVRSASPWGGKILEEYRRLSVLGKNLRPCLVILGYRIAGKSSDDRILDDRIFLASLSVEILHNAFLIHDDIVDKSHWRRNELTLHKRFEEKFLEEGLLAECSAETGVAIAMNFGDLGQALAQQILLSSGYSNEKMMACIKLFNDSLWRTVIGQIRDVCPSLMIHTKGSDVEGIHRDKTAYYSFVLPLILGYVLGDGEEREFELLEAFAIRVGIIYQMQDDVLGVFGDAVELGKSVDTDVKEGKKTLLIHTALRNANSDERKELLALYGSPGIDQLGIKRIREIMEKTGALDYSYRRIEELKDEALEYLGKLSIPSGEARLLSGVAHYAGNRQK